MYSINKMDVPCRDYEDRIIVYNLRTSEIIDLRDVSADIWRLIYKNVKIECTSIVETLCNIYEVSEDEVLNDVNEFLSYLHINGYLLNNGKYADITYNSNIDLNNIDDVEKDIVEDLRKDNQLYSVTFELTYNCNEKCIHCYALNTSLEDERLLNISEYKKIIDELYEMKCFHIAFTGGDPFVYKDFYEIFKYARTKGFICDIYTNGQILSKNNTLLNNISILKPRVVYISLYGSTYQIHDNITQTPNSFTNTINAIKKLKENDVSVVINIMLLNRNKEDIDNIISLVKTLKCDYRIGLSIINTNDGNSSPMKYFVNDKETLKKIIKKNQQKLLSETRVTDSNMHICGAALSSISISPNGVVYPCISVKKCLGNIHENTINAIWNGVARNNFLTLNTWHYSEECQKCKYIDICAHCIGISEQEYGNIHSCNTCDKMISSAMYEVINDI